MQTAELAAVEGRPMRSQARPQKFPAQRGKSESAQTLHQAGSTARVELGEGSGVVLLSTSRGSLLQHQAFEPPYPCPAFPGALPTLPAGVYPRGQRERTCQQTEGQPSAQRCPRLAKPPLNKAGRPRIKAPGREGTEPRAEQGGRRGRAQCARASCCCCPGR